MVHNDAVGRNFLPVQWDTSAAVCLGPPRDTIGTVIGMRVDSGGTWLDDASQNRLVRLSVSGDVETVVGRQGGGPGEFQAPRDIELTARGDLAVLDPANARITLVNPRGGISTEIPLRSVGHAEQFAPLPSGGFLLATMRPDSPLVEVDPHGRSIRRLAFQWHQFSQLQPLAAQLISAVSRDGRYAVFGMRFGEAFFVVGAGPGDLKPISYVEPMTAPRLRPQVIQGDTTYSMPLMPMSATDLVVAGARVLVLSEGRTANRDRQLDVYALPAGRYLHSVVLPRRVSMIAPYANSIQTLFYTVDRLCLQRLRPLTPWDTVLAGPPVTRPGSP